jgi:hypothetical protein
MDHPQTHPAQPGITASDPPIIPKSGCIERFFGCLARFGVKITAFAGEDAKIKYRFYSLFSESHI